ncbi:hypothetical protein C3744_21970 [Priestia megaterium]|uniref:Uncharacterized protein n=1 Tax=Priestia megaterium TaxID=1404 RepID=A0A3D8WWS3_PRIMG|nr:hypothetical protein [Priestia megaterium]MDH3171464.1 hypothetical protein [Priestia megaterium]RDZ11042.1 hypothetical protein C3744_21970 [Priestia megaterium]
MTKNNQRYKQKDAQLLGGNITDTELGQELGSIHQEQLLTLFSSCSCFFKCIPSYRMLSSIMNFVRINTLKYILSEHIANI